MRFFITILLILNIYIQADEIENIYPFKIVDNSINNLNDNVLISKDNNYILSVNWERYIVINNIKNNEKYLLYKYLNTNTLTSDITLLNHYAINRYKNIINIIDLDKKEIIKTIKLQSRDYSSSKFSINSKFLLLEWFNKTADNFYLRVYNLENLSYKDIALEDYIDLKYTISPNGKYVIIQFGRKDSSELVIYDITKNEEYKRIKFKAPIEKFSFSNNGKYLLVVGYDRYNRKQSFTKIINFKNLSTILEFNEDLSRTYISSDNNFLISHLGGNLFSIWDIGLKKHIVNLRLKDKVSHKTKTEAKFSFNIKYIIAHDSERVFFYNFTKYNRVLADKIYNEIDKNDYMTLYQFTKKFYYKLDAVQKAYRDIYNAVKKVNDYKAYYWYVVTFNGLNKKEQKAYRYYKQHYDSYSKDEFNEIQEKLNELDQKKFNKKLESIKKFDNVHIFKYLIKSNSFRDVTDAFKETYKIMFKKAKEINTISAYNSFIIAYPNADEVEEANKLAYNLEKKQYTDLGFFSFWNKDEKMNKQARKILIKAKELENIALDKFNGDEQSIGFYIIINRMYNLVKNEFGDTDTALNLLESNKYKMVKDKIDNFLKYKIKTYAKLNYLPYVTIDSYIFTKLDIVDKKLKDFFLKQDEKSKDIINKLREEKQNELNKLDFSKIKEEKIKSFNKIYKEALKEYEQQVNDINSNDGLDINKIVSKNDNYTNRAIQSNNNLNNNMNNSPSINQNVDSTSFTRNISNNQSYKNSVQSNIEEKIVEDGCDDPAFNKMQDVITLSNENMDIKLHYKIIDTKIKFDIVATNLSGKSLKGGVSISFPAINNNIVIKTNKGSFSSLKAYPKGAKIWNKTLHQAIPANYLLVEAWSNKWRAGEIKRASFELNMKNITYLKTQLRGVLLNKRAELLTPQYGIVDQQGYGTKRIGIYLPNNNNIKSFNYSSSSNISNDGFIDVYYAKISQKDKYSSSGKKLKKVSAILQQDRANYHKFYKRDREDTSDIFFTTKENRDKLKYMLKYISPAMEDNILNSYPLVKVAIYKDHIEVSNITKITSKKDDDRVYINLHNYPYVCYKQKVSKVMYGKKRDIYLGCYTSKTPCSHRNDKHFGKYPNDYKSFKAARRCSRSTPKFID